MDPFRTIVSAYREMADELPLVHTSECENLSSFVASHQINPSYCTVFKESLVFLFYGRPAYRSKKGQQPGESVQLCPVCFVFKPRTVSKRIRRVFPCDTGALGTDLFNPPLTVADLGNLELEPRIESAQRLVPLLFENNQNYFLGKARSSLVLSAGTPVQRFHQLLITPGPVGYDDRKSAIEVQVEEPISLRNQLLCVILPREFLDTREIRTTILYEWNCDPIHYSTVIGDAPSQYYSVIRQELLKRFREATRL